MSASAVIGRVAAVAVGFLLIAGCAASSKPAITVPAQGRDAAPVTAVLAPCAAFDCTAGAVQQLSGGYSVRLWSAAAPSADNSQALRSTPVLELLHDGQHSSWWTGRIGYGWATTVRCLATPDAPNCVVLAGAGAHAGVAEVVLLAADGVLTSPATASVIFDSGTPLATDLDHDGRLDVIGVENDYVPDYASGHNYWTTYRLSGNSLKQTGCSPITKTAPTALLTGRCPKVAQG
jgi:hypothetical protein